MQGGSTITQQYVKNAYAGNERSIARKVREAALAWQLENQWRDKDRILTAYLNTIYFGNGAYGIQQAARIYFGNGREAADARRGGAARRRSRRTRPTTTRSRTRRTRSRGATSCSARCHDQGYITAAGRAAAASAPLPQPEDVRQPGTQSPHAPYFTNYVTEQLRRPLRRREGLRRRPARQDDDRPRAAGARAQGDRGAPRRPGTGPQAALVALDPTHGQRPRDGRRPQLPREPVQPRRPGAAAAGLRVQAVRARDGAREGDQPGDDDDVDASSSIPLGDKFWTPSQLRGRLPRPDHARDGDGALRQRRLRAARRPRRARRRRPRRPPDGRDEPAEAVLLARASARRRRTRSSSRGRTRRSRTRASGSTSAAASRARPGTARAPWTRSRTSDGHVVDDFRQQPRRVLSERTASTVNRLLQGVVQRGHGDARGDPRLERRGQDRHDRELRRRVVRRLHARARGRRLGRLPEASCGRC